MLRVISRRLGLVVRSTPGLAVRSSARGYRAATPQLHQASSAVGRSSRPSSARHDAAAAATAQAVQPQDIPDPVLDPPFAASSSIGSRSDDSLLKAHFDEPYNPTTAGGSKGLFRLAPLADPSHLPRLTDRTLIQARAIVSRITQAPTDPTGRELRLVVKNLDRLSDVLCGVIDMCELVRNVSPDDEWVGQADAAYERLCSFMNELNTHQGLYESLRKAIHHPHATPLSEAEMQVALTFMRDFEKSGIHLPSDVRARFVGLSDSLLGLGRTFLANASSGPPTKPLIEIPDADRLLSGLGSQFIEALPRGRLAKRSSRYVVPGSWEAQMIARYAREGEARRLVYVGGLYPDPGRLEVLEQMLKERAELAGVLGKANWAEVVLDDKMAKNPENVMRFLQSLADHHRPAAAADVAALQRLKASSLTGNVIRETDGTGHLPPLHAWDRDYYAERLGLTKNASSLPPITPYFSTGSVMLGLSRLFSRLYGISLRPSAIAPGEVWHPSVRRLDVIDETEGQIGYIYCDLFTRPGKSASAAHYTVRCSRRVDDDDILGDELPDGWVAGLGPGLEGDGVMQSGRQGRYQLPIVVLTMDCGLPIPGRPALLNWTDVETVFHEMGHAIHSMIGRTEYHNVSGTRCATDFVELPSILMEHFLSSPQVLSLFAMHYDTGEPLPPALVRAHLDLQSSLAALETHGQITMALLDQVYHSLRPDELDGFDSSRVYHELQERTGVIPPVEGTAWQTNFGHLYGYGATYYSYLFDRAIAGKIFGTLFTPQADSRDAGEVLKNKLLKWGGGKDPWAMVGDVVGGREGAVISRGDEKAMQMVGSWTLKE